MRIARAFFLRRAPPVRIVVRTSKNMPAKNLYLDESLSTAAAALAQVSPRHRSLSGLVSYLLVKHLRSNPAKLRAVCRKNGIEYPEEMISG